MTSLRAALRFPLLASALLLAAGPGCGGTAEKDSDRNGESQCVVDGVSYAVGDSVPSHDCNSCICGEEGRVGCTTASCGDGDISAGGGYDCVFEGNRYYSGAIVFDDGCNSCTCQSNGDIACTAIACGDGDGDTGYDCLLGENGYFVGDTIPSDGCSSCICQSSGSFSCIGIPCGDGDGDVGGGNECVQNGVTYASGEPVPSRDCNSCFCENGSVLCTLEDCPEPPDRCELPFEVGNCDDAILVYFHNVETGFCEEATYGGCGGNDNRFATLEECQAACTPPPPGVSCEVDGVTYPHGANNVPDPASCNTCSCDDGQVTGCTEIGCPVVCEAGTALGSECAECGPTDACLSVRSGCLPTCETQEDCNAAGGGVCLDGLCKNVCG